MSAVEELKIDVPGVGRVSGILQMPDDVVALFVLGHGTGSDMAYSVISGLATELSARGVATLRFHYPYSDHPDYVAQSGMATDTLDVMMAVMRAVVLRAGTLAPDLPVFAGGHSMSAEVASNAESITALQARGLILLGYPMRDAGKSHLPGINVPVLVVQGTEDHLGSVADITRMGDVLGGGGEMQFIKGASHRFEREGASQRTVLGEVADAIREFVTEE